MRPGSLRLRKTPTGGYGTSALTPCFIYPYPPKSSAAFCIIWRIGRLYGQRGSRGTAPDAGTGLGLQRRIALAAPLLQAVAVQVPLEQEHTGDGNPHRAGRTVVAAAAELVPSASRTFWQAASSSGVSGAVLAAPATLAFSSSTVAMPGWTP